MPFPASHRQLRVVTNFPVPLLSSTIAHLVRFPQLRSPLGLSHFPAWESLGRALRMPSPPAGPCCVDQTQPPARVCSLPPLRDGMKAALQKELAAVFWGAAAVKAHGSVRHYLSEWHAFIPEKQELGWMWAVAFPSPPPPPTGSRFAL